MARRGRQEPVRQLVVHVPVLGEDAAELGVHLPQGAAVPGEAPLHLGEGGGPLPAGGGPVAALAGGRRRELEAGLASGGRGRGPGRGSGRGPATSPHPAPRIEQLLVGLEVVRAEGRDELSPPRQAQRVDQEAGVRQNLRGHLRGRDEGGRRPPRRAVAVVVRRRGRRRGAAGRAGRAAAAAAVVVVPHPERGAGPAAHAGVHLGRPPRYGRGRGQGGGGAGPPTPPSRPLRAAAARDRPPPLPFPFPLHPLSHPSPVDRGHESQPHVAEAEDHPLPEVLPHGPDGLPDVPHLLDAAHVPVEVAKEQPRGVEEAGSHGELRERDGLVGCRVEAIDGVKEHVEALEGGDGPAEVALGVVEPLHVAGDVEDGPLGPPGPLLDGPHPRPKALDGPPGPGHVGGGGVGQVGLRLDGGRDGLVQAPYASRYGGAEGGEGSDQGGLGPVVVVQEVHRIEPRLLGGGGGGAGAGISIAAGPGIGPGTGIGTGTGTGIGIGIVNGTGIAADRRRVHAAAEGADRVQHPPHVLRRGGRHDAIAAASRRRGGSRGLGGPGGPGGSTSSASGGRHGRRAWFGWAGLGP